MGFNDLVITPIYFLIIIFLAFVLRNRFTNSANRKHFIPALFLRLCGAIVIGLVYQFYYNGGDTFTFWEHGSRWVWSAFQEDSWKGFGMIFGNMMTNDLHEFNSPIWVRGSTSGMFIVRLAGFFDILTYHTYSATALFFGIIGFSGSWALYSILSTKYPYANKYLTVFILYMPSIVFWGSGIMKDTITFAAICWMLWALIRIINFKKRGIPEVLVFALSVVILAQVKIYILISLIPCIFLWLFFTRYLMVKNRVARILVAPFLLLCFVVPAFYLSIAVTGLDKRFAFDNLAERSRITAHDIRFYSGKDAGSGYTLGEHDGTWTGMLKLAPSGILTVLFRPFIWEVSNPLMLLSGLESLFIAVLLFNTRVWKNVKYLFKDPFLLFSLIFVLIFAFAIGVSTFNFGTLVRYRIPIFPFLGVLIGCLRSTKFSHRF